MKALLLFFFFLLMGKAGYGQFNSDYPGLLLKTTPTEIKLLQKGGKGLLFFAQKNAADSVFIMSYSIDNKTFDTIAYLNYPIKDFCIHPVQQDLYTLTMEGVFNTLQAKRPVFLQKMDKRGIVVQDEICFNTTGNMLAFVGKEPKAAPGLLTYDLKYDNLNNHFGKHRLLHQVEWSANSGLISGTCEPGDGQRSCIQILEWSGKMMSTIASDTLDFIGASWGATNNRLLCLAKAASGHYILKCRPTGELIEVILKSDLPIGELCWIETQKKVFFTSYSSDGNVDLWQINIELTY